MQNSRPVLLTAAASGSVAIVAALFGADQFAAQAGVLALGALGVLVAARHEAVRRVRWSLLAGIAVLAVAVAVPDMLTSPVVGPQLLKPAAGGAGSFVRDAVADEWLTTVAVLLASAAFLWALTAGTASEPAPAEQAPAESRRRDPVVVAAAVGSLLIIVAGADLALAVAAQKRDGAAGGLLVAVGFPLAVAVLAIGSAVFGAYRATVGGDGTNRSEGVKRADVAGSAVAAGGLLLAVAALAVVYLGILSAPLPYGDAGDLIFDAAVIRTGWGDLDLIAALRLTGMLAGAGGIVYGTARASEEARAGEEKAGEDVSPDGSPA
ncbi:hypothetical protein [Actinoplanes sp. NPDC026670]|uniref:hypothetical protein n=1 Tax=Actinoplanes sp. NPDC026670 TaxID=3154700 RepID=UPI0033E25DF9